jgi:microsomal epoxide hydrolase
MKITLVLAAWLLSSFCAWAHPVKSQFFKTSDGLSLHYLEAGSGHRSLVFVPGWLMPAEIFEEQILALSADHRVLVLDPRGQGRSKAPPQRLQAAARARDIDELLQQAQVGEHVLIGWSLGVMEVLDHTVRHPNPQLRGLVLIDNSIGMGRAPASTSGKAKRPIANDEFRAYIQRFASAIFKHPPPPGWLQAIETSATQLPPKAAWGLLDKPYGREYYKKAVLALDVPLWYAITPRFAEQSLELTQTHPRASATVFEDAGHALFVDSAAQFNRGMKEFLERMP